MPTVLGAGAWVCHAGEHTTDSLTAEEAVALATQFLQRRRAAGAAVELKAMKKSMALLSNAAKDSTVFVLGLGIHLHSIAKVRA